MEKTFDFLKRLKKNNEREWFNKNKDRFQESKNEFEELVQEISSHLQSHDEIDLARTKVFRIYRDVRFSKDKTPYNPYWRTAFYRAGKERRGTYYMHLEPGSTVILGGFYGPESQDLKHIREQISLDPDPLRALMKKSSFKNYFGNMEGEKLKTAPKGFEKDDPSLDLIQHKSFYFRHEFSDAEVLDPKFPKTVSEGWKKIRPFFDYMSEILTTDLNGNPI